MKQKFTIAAIVLMFIMAACQKEDLRENQPQPELKSSHVKSASQGVTVFHAKLSGAFEVPSNDSKASGHAVFHLNKEGTELHYRLFVNRLDNVVQSHIHLGEAGTNGGVVAWLYPSQGPGVIIPGTSNGLLYNGVIKEEDLVGVLMEADFSDFLQHLKAGNTYVNVHTTQFPGGEVRGQIY